MNKNKQPSPEGENLAVEKVNVWKNTAFVLIFLLLLSLVVDVSEINGKEAVDNKKEVVNQLPQVDLYDAVIPQDGFELPVVWGDLGKQMVEKGVIDENKFEQLYASRGGLNEDERKLLYGDQNRNIKINKENSGFLLNMLWALGLSNKNLILEEGSMQSPEYGGDASRFASTGGWSLSRGNVMDHYSKYPFITLTSEQQSLVEEVSKNIYRPCCGNSTYFPDCNHGMAMLGLLELLASQGVGKSEMYDVALQVNSYWFPDTYLTIGKYFEGQGIEWDNVDAKKVLGIEYSSAQGYKQVLAKVTPTQTQGGGGCGV